uniref:Uncharacterized protein n=1 Tax=Panagrolaimus sp. ES5 TaxID=591445 RepID=A0AC34GQG0_9BILA
MQICGEHAIAVDQNIQDKPAPDDTPHQIPSPYLTKQATQILARPRDTQPLGGGILYPSHVSTPQHPPIYDDPDLFKIHPVFEDDLDDEEENINNDDENIEEFETSAYRNPLNNPSQTAQEWSAKTETRFFPNLGLRNRTFSNDLKLKLTASAPPMPLTTPIPTTAPEIVTTLTPVVESEPITTTSKLILTPTPILTSNSIDITSMPPPTPTPPEADTSMLLNLRPPAEFLSKNKKRNVEAEVVETNFRTNRQSRRSSGTSQPSTNVEEFETEFKKPSLTTAKKESYEKYDTPHVKGNSPQTPPQLGYAQAGSRNPRTRYHEEAETQFLRHSYLNPPVFPGYPILKSLNSEGHRIPQPVPQGLINQLIAQHLALRERLGQTQKVPVIQAERPPNTRHSVEVRETPFRRVSEIQTPAETSRILTYAEKRRRWKEEMKKKLKKQKVPARQIIRPIITGEKNKYYVTYSPYYRLYQVSRQPPKGLNITGNKDITTTTVSPLTVTLSTTSAPVEVISPYPPITAPGSSSSPTTTPATSKPSTTTTAAPKVVSLKVEPMPVSSSKNTNKMQVRVAAIKPTSEAKGKQLLYMDDEDDEWKVEEEDYYVDENGQLTERMKHELSTTTTTVIPPIVITTTPDSSLAAIVFPVGHTTEAPRTISTSTTASSKAAEITTRKPIEQVTPGADYILPEAPANKQDYTDYGHSEEDLFFWKPEFESRRTRIDPSSQNSATESFNEELPNNNDDDNDAFEITVHNPNKKL